MSGSLDAPRLYLDADMSAVELQLIAGGEVAVFSAKSPDREGLNEDSAALLPFGGDAAVLAVADGAGGARSGARASTIALETLAAALAEAERDGSMLRTAILNGIERANQAVCDLGVGAATTLALVELRGGTARSYHVGDSPILIIGQRGKIKLETVSHSPVGFAIEAGLLDANEAIHHEDRHLVSNLLGSTDMRIEMGSERKLAARDTLVLASDGLSDNVHVAEIVEAVRNGPLRDVSENLASTARGRMYAPKEGDPSKPDDLTILVFRPTPPARRAARSSRAPRS